MDGSYLIGNAAFYSWALLTVFITFLLAVLEPPPGKTNIFLLALGGAISSLVITKLLVIVLSNSYMIVFLLQLVLVFVVACVLGLLVRKFRR